MQDVEKQAVIGQKHLAMEKSVAAFIEDKFILPQKQVGTNCSYGLLSSVISEGSSLPYLRLDGGRLDSDFMEDVYELLTKHWHLPHPNLIIEVTGSTEEFTDLSEDKIAQLKVAIRYQVNSKDVQQGPVWLITGGINSGAMRLVGEALAGCKSAPCIGITTWAVLMAEDRMRMEEGNGKSVPYTSFQGDKHKLNMDHSCFLLADGSNREFSQEISFRSRFIDYLSTTKFSTRIPVATMVIGGGPDCLQTANIAVAAQLNDLNSGRLVEPRALIVLKDTGRTADAIDLAADFYAKNKECGLAEFRRAMASSKVIEPILSPLLVGDAALLSAGLERARNSSWSTQPLPPPYEKLEKISETDGAIEWVMKCLLNLAMRRHMIHVIDTNMVEKTTKNVFDIASELSSPSTRARCFAENNFPVILRCNKFTKIEAYELSEIGENLLKRLNVENLCTCGRDNHPPNEGGVRTTESLQKMVNKTAIRNGTLKFCPYVCDEESKSSLMDFIPSYSKFIRLPYDRSARDEAFYLHKVYTILTEFWQIPKPQLLLEVTGTVDDLRFVDNLAIDDLKTALIRVAKTSKAWLVSGGTNCGVMKVIGDAVATDRVINGGIGVPCLGIAPWGMIENREDVFTIVDSAKNPYLVEYPFRNDENYSSRHGNGSYVELNPGFDSFILVDSGKENRFGEEIIFRQKLLKFISEQSPLKSKSSSTQTPCVMLVVGGDTFHTIQRIYDGLYSNGQRPKSSVIIKGFGGCGDFLASLYSWTSKHSGIELEKLVKAHPFFNREAHRLKKAADALYAEIKPSWEAIFVKEDLLYFFDMSSGSPKSTITLDDAILEAMFLEDPAALDEQTVMSSFELTLQWNQWDFAKKLLSSKKAFETLQRSEKESGFMEKAMTTTIKCNQPEIFEMFHNCGLMDVRVYFLKNDRRLEILFHKLLWHPSSWNKKYVSSQHLQLFTYLLNRTRSKQTIKFGEYSSFRLHYDGSSSSNEKLGSIMTAVEKVFRSNFRLPPSVNLRAVRERTAINCKELGFEMNIRDLFLLKLFLCRDHFAVAIWKVVQVSDYLGTAIMASVFLGELAKAAKVIHRQDLFGTYEKLSTKWEERALALMENLAENHPNSFRLVLTRSLRTWYGLTVLQLAYYGGKMRLIAHSAVQTELEKVWKGQWLASSDEPNKDINATRVFQNKPVVPPLATGKSKATVAPLGGIQADTKAATAAYQLTSTTCSNAILATKAIIRFYKLSPLVKFSFHAFFLLAFLLVLFGDVIINTHEPLSCSKSPGVRVIVLWVCALAFTADTINEIKLFEMVTFNCICTLFGFVFMLTSCVLRLTCYFSPITSLQNPAMFNVSRIFHAVSCAFFWFKCFRILFVSKSFGPQALTFFEMFKSVAFYAILHFIILFAFSGPIYSVSSMADVRDVNADTVDYLALMARIVYYRWWQIVGVSMELTKDRTLRETCAKTLADDYTGNYTSIVSQLGATSSQTSEIDWLCNVRRITGSAMLMLFLVLTNVLLLSMLIGSLSYTIDAFRRQAEELWKFSRFHLIKNFAEKSILPPPFNLFELVIFNTSVFKRLLPKRWSTSLETFFNVDPDGVDEIDESDETYWRNKYQLAKFRYQEINRLEKTAVLKVLIDERQQSVVPSK